MHDVDIYVGKRLRQARHLCQMTQQELAEQLGVKFQQVQKYETGANRVSASRLVMICRAMDLTPSYFFEGLGFEDQGDVPNLDLDRREAALVNSFRGLSGGEQELLEKLTRAITTK